MGCGGKGLGGRGHTPAQLASRQRPCAGRRPPAPPACRPHPDPLTPTPPPSPLPQAMDRAHRLGQQRTVNVYRLLVRARWRSRS